MNRHLNLALTITCTAGSALYAATNQMGYSVIAGVLALLNFAIWIATAKDDKVVDR